MSWALCTLRYCRRGVSWAFGCLHPTNQDGGDVKTTGGIEAVSVLLLGLVSDGLYIGARLMDIDKIPA